MLEQIIPILLAVLGLSLLVFVHELGHLLAAMKCNMEVESFGIGFGKPIFSFIYKKIRFNICWIPFGGYVKIVGMDNTSQPIDPKKNTFFTSKPFHRLSVAFSGPFANILFSFFIFCSIWATGGRNKSYSSITSRVGWVDPTSELYLKGLRPGDKIISYGGREVSSSQDHLQAAMTNGSTLSVQFENLGSYVKPAKRISCTITPYQFPRAQEGVLTTGVFSPATFVVWNPALLHQENGVELSFPASRSIGIEPLDRIIWIDNVSIFSLDEVKAVINDEVLLCTVQKSDEESRGARQMRIPRIKISDLKLTPEIKGELSDWEYMAGLNGKKREDLWFIPYNISSEGVIEHVLSPIDNTVQVSKYQIDTLSPGDKIIAVHGEPVQHAFEIFSKAQEKKALMIVVRDGMQEKHFSSQVFSDFEHADISFTAPFASKALYDLISTIGSSVSEKIASLPAKKLGDRESTLRVLRPLSLIPKEQFIEYISEHQERTVKLHDRIKSSREYVLGLFGVVDSSFAYNPNPGSMIIKSAQDVAYTLYALITGNLSPKWMAGPIGIVDSIQQQMSVSGCKESLFWLAMLSVNLALLNLLPLPALDGGYILLSLIEQLTGIKPSVSTLEKIVFPFILILIGLFIYLSYNDLVRLLVRLL